MAAYGGFIPLSSSNNWEGVVEWYYSQNVLVNTTTITVYIKSNTTNSTTQTLGETCFYGTILVAGKQSSFAYEVETSTSTQHHKFEVEVRHNGSGRLPNCLISCTINAAASNKWNFSSASLSGSLDIAKYIPVIPTESEFDSISDIYFGENVSISWYPTSPSYYYKLTFDFEKRSYSEVIRPGTTNLYTYKNFKVPNDWASEIPNLSIGFIQVTMCGYSDSTCTVRHGKESRATFTLSVPDSFSPTITSCTSSIDNTETSVPSSWNVAVANHSKVNIKAQASGKYGATIKSFRITGAATATTFSSSLDYTSPVLRSAGEKEFTVICTDSRGMVSAEFKTSAISFLDCFIPRIKIFTASRSKNSSTGKVSISIKADWDFSSVGGKNTSSAKLYYKLSTVDDWTLYTSSNPFPKNNKVTLNITVDEYASYNFKIIITDALSQIAEKEIFSSSSTVLLDFKAGGDGLGIGKTCEESGLDIAFITRFRDEVYIKGKTLAQYIMSFIDPLYCIEEDLYASDWKSSNNDGKAPYYQTKTRDGMTSTRDYGPPFLFGEKDSQTLESEKEALSYISYGTTGNGYITFYCLDDKPRVDITIRMQGVIISS